MPEMSTKFVPKHKGDKNPNPKLLKFVRHVTDRVPGKIKMDTDAPEYWGLACIFEDEMDATTREASLDLLLDMLPGNFFKVREHHTYAELHEWNAKKHYTPDDAMLWVRTLTPLFASLPVKEIYAAILDGVFKTGFIVAVGAPMIYYWKISPEVNRLILKVLRKN